MSIKRMLRIIFKKIINLKNNHNLDASLWVQRALLSKNLKKY